MGRPVIPLIITDKERDELHSWVRRRQMPAAEQQRARMILLSTEGLPGRVIAERVGVTAETVSKWRKRFEQFRVAGLTDAPRSGRPRSIDDDKVTDVINKTLQSKPKDATHWSTTLMAKELGSDPVCRRKEPDTGAEPHPAGASAVVWLLRNPNARLCSSWHDNSVCSPGRCHWRGYRTPSQETPS